MKINHTLTFQLGTLIAGILVVMVLITSIATYKTAYDKLYDAAGVEAYGCANITTGLLDSNDIDKAIAGDQTAKDKISKQIEWTVKHKDIFETQYILDLNGKILALDHHLAEKGFSTGDSFYIDKEAINMLVKMKHSTYSKPYTYGGLKRITGYAPIYKDHDPNKEIVAVSAIDFDASIVQERTWDVVKEGILISIIPMLLATIITFMLIRRKTNPISKLIEQAKQIAEGNLDVKEVKIKSKDEIGDLALTLNKMTSNLQEMVSTMQKTSHQLTDNAHETSTSLNEMSNAVQVVSNNIEEVSVSISDGTHRTENAADMLISLANDFRNMKEQADSTVEKSNHTKEIASNGEERAKDIRVDMELIQKGSKEVSETILDLVESAKKIQNITTSISGIAEQTNLLALNASIEAARAGEHGKGFAVVAEEVRKLAEQSNEEVLKVNNLVNDIMNRIQHVLTSADDNTKYIEKGSETVQQTVQTLKDISVSVAETVKEITTISEMMTAETSKADQVGESLVEFTKTIKNIENTIVDISAAAEQTTAGIDEVSKRSETTNKMAVELENNVQYFHLKQ
ncbi:MAG: methyl-accepting chemotaxis protein [Rummeliibacillus sp.]